MCSLKAQNGLVQKSSGLAHISSTLKLNRDLPIMSYQIICKVASIKNIDNVQTEDVTKFRSDF